MLAEDAAFAMPPLADAGSAAATGSAASSSGWPLLRRLALARRSRSRANGQPALAFYSWDEEQGATVPFALNVLTFEGEQISDVDRLHRAVHAGSRTREVRRGRPSSPPTTRRLAAAFERFGLPERAGLTGFTARLTSTRSNRYDDR